MIERRFFRQGTQLRAKNENGKKSLDGYAAVFGAQYDNGWFIETIKSGAFGKVLGSTPDVRALFNHNPDHVLGRTKSKTLTLDQDNKGLHFTNDLPATPRGDEVHALVDRGDIDGCSFSFIPSRQTWREEPDPNDPKRKLLFRDIEEFEQIFDVGPVTFPAYEDTSVQARSLQLVRCFPEGLPAEIRSHVPGIAAVLTRAGGGDGDDINPSLRACRCSCRACYSAECNECDQHMADCGDSERCDHTNDQDRSRRADGKKTKRVDGEDLPASSFLHVGDPEKTATWSLPWKFSTVAKIKSHLRNALARFNQTKNIPADKKAGVWKKLVAKCKKYGVQVSSEESKAWGFTAEQRADVRGLIGSGDECQCDCPECQVGNHTECSEPDCQGLEDGWNCDHEEDDEDSEQDSKPMTNETAQARLRILLAE